MLFLRHAAHADHGRRLSGRSRHVPLSAAGPAPSARFDELHQERGWTQRNRRVAVAPHPGLDVDLASIGTMGPWGARLVTPHEEVSA